MRGWNILSIVKGVRAKRIDDVKPTPELMELLRVYEEKVRDTEEYRRCLSEVGKEGPGGICRRVCGLVAATRVLGEKRYREIANTYYASLPPQKILPLIKELVKLEQVLGDCFRSG